MNFHRLNFFGLVFLGLANCKARSSLTKEVYESSPPRTEIISNDQAWAPLVNLKLGSEGKPYCTGSLVGVNLVLTAAHCISKGPSNIRAGKDSHEDYQVGWDQLKDTKICKLIEEKNWTGPTCTDVSRVLVNGYDFLRYLPKDDSEFGKVASISRDYALLEIAAPIGKTFFRVGIVPWKDLNKLELSLGVGAGNHFVQLKNRPYSIEKFLFSDVITYTGIGMHASSIEAGASGGPLIVNLRGKDPYLIAGRCPRLS